MPLTTMPEPLDTAPAMGETTEQDQEVDNSAQDDELISRTEIRKLEKALKAERESRKTFEKELAKNQAQLQKFAEINPDEYRRLQEEAAIAERERLQAEERTSLLEEKYGSQAAEANKRAEQAAKELQEYRKRYALEKVFVAAEGRTDGDGQISFFDMLADKLGSHFRLEANGSIVVVDGNGDPVLDGDTGKRVDPKEYLAKFREHPVYGTFFKGVRGSGAGLGLGGTDSRGLTTEDFDSLPSDEKFLRAFA
jgi:vacuolar-type H+-ATPase subunit I/STV1